MHRVKYFAMPTVRSIFDKTNVLIQSHSKMEIPRDIILHKTLCKKNIFRCAKDSSYAGYIQISDNYVEKLKIMYVEDPTQDPSRKLVFGMIFSIALQTYITLCSSRNSDNRFET